MQSGIAKFANAHPEIIRVFNLRKRGGLHEAFQDFQSLFTYCLRKPTVVHKNLHWLYLHFMNVLAFNNDTEQGSACWTEGMDSSCKRQGKLCLTFEAARDNMKKTQKDSGRCIGFEEDGKMSHST